MAFKCIFMVMIFLLCECSSKEYNIFCQYDLASYYFKDHSQFFDWNIDSRLCTHLVIGSGVGVDEETGELRITDKDLLLGNDMPSRVKHMKSDSIRKVLATIGGWQEDSKHFSNMVASHKKRDNFYNSMLEFVHKWRFDGVQIDWRYPTQGGGQSEDRKNFVLLLEELKLIFREHKLILMVAVLGRTNKRNLESYDIPGIVKNSDFIHLMMHDERDLYRLRLAYNAPLRGSGNGVADAIKLWKSQGKAPEKLILGIPFFVRSYTMDNNQTAVGSLSKGPGKQTKSSRRPGFMTYNEWCVQESSWSKKFDKVAMVPYASKGDQWVSYENPGSIWAKMHMLQQHMLGGAMAWTVDVDDFLGTCGERHGLLRVIFSALGDQNALTTETPTTEPLGLCPFDGFWSNDFDCSLYHECRNGERFYHKCPEGQYFDEIQIDCRPAAEVNCLISHYENWPLDIEIVE
ncbi:endochitinase [Drosophila eugracilis]|uniref:endochitinase n=1 Tax=Drosophila eugracilis TaxID=29029 RepID=UPI0007E792C7|nr:endochitinase [Drosophila eugracilis]